MKAIFFSLAAIVSAVIAAPTEYFFDIKQPQENTVYRVGQSVPLSWDHGTNGKAIVTVLKGDNPREMIPTSYQFEVDGNARSASWKIPSGLSSSEKYNFEITYFSGPNHEEGKSYSGQFSVSNEVPQEQTTVATTAGDNNSGGGKKNKSNTGDNQTGGSMQGTSQGSLPQQGSSQQTQGAVTQGNPTVQSNGVRASQGRASAAQANMPVQSSNKMTMASNGGGGGNSVQGQGYSNRGFM